MSLESRVVYILIFMSLDSRVVYILILMYLDRRVVYILIFMFFDSIVVGKRFCTETFNGISYEKVNLIDVIGTGDRTNDEVCHSNWEPHRNFCLILCSFPTFTV